MFAGVDLAGPEIGCHEFVTAKDIQRQKAIVIVVAMEKPLLLVAVGWVVCVSRIIGANRAVLSKIAEATNKIPLKKADRLIKLSEGCTPWFTKTAEYSTMYHELPRAARFWSILLAIDHDLAETARNRHRRSIRKKEQACDMNKNARGKDFASCTWRGFAELRGLCESGKQEPIHGGAACDRCYAVGWKECYAQSVGDGGRPSNVSRALQRMS